MKFKLWHKEEKRMIDEGGYFIETDGSVWQNYPDKDGDHLVEITDVVEIKEE